MKKYIMPETRVEEIGTVSMIALSANDSAADANKPALDKEIDTEDTWNIWD